jgi:hypothetical protein
MTFLISSRAHITSGPNGDTAEGTSSTLNTIRISTSSIAGRDGPRVKKGMLPSSEKKMSSGKYETHLSVHLTSYQNLEEIRSKKYSPTPFPGNGKRTSYQGNPYASRKTRDSELKIQLICFLRY